MKKILVVSMCAVALFLFSMEIAAQSDKNLKSGSGFTRLYRSGTIEHMDGKIQAVKNLVPANSNHKWLVVILNSDNNSIPIYIAPTWYLNGKDFNVKEGNIVKIKGARVLIDGGAAILAGEIQKDNTSLVLRNKIGLPAWQGSGRR